jgi:hypothetical protein
VSAEEVRLKPDTTPDVRLKPDTTSEITYKPVLLTLGLFVGLAVLHTWPLASAPGTLSRNDNGDFILHEWIMAWVSHQVVTNPLHLFDANIFYPERYTLAYSDHLFVQSMLGAPFLWAGASPVLVHNLVLMAGFALTGWATCLVMQRWTGSWLAAIVSGTLVAFNAFTLTRLPQIQDLHLEFFLPAMYALDRLLSNDRVRDGLMLACWFVLQALTGLYLMVFTLMSLLVAALVRPADWFGGRFRTLAAPLLIGAAVAVVALLPFLLPYYHARETVGLGRSLEETARYSAEWTDYLAAPGRVYFDWFGKRFFQGDALFPGITASLLAIVGIAAGGWNDRRARMTIAFGLMAFALSFGPAFPPYRWLYRMFPLLSGIRGAVRFGEITLVAIGVLAGFGVAALQRRLPAKWATAAAIAVFFTANAEALRAPLFYSEYHGIPQVYDALNNVGRKAILVSFPFYASAQFHQNAPLMLASTQTFNPMLNGYSGFKPASFYKNVEELAGFPDERSIAHLQRLGVSVVLVDGRNMRPANLARLPEFPQLSKIADDGNLRIYLLANSSANDSAKD